MESLFSLKDQPAPMEKPAFDPFYCEFKHADVLPEWLKLQHSIRTRLERLMADAFRMQPADLAARLRSINDLIIDYNQNVPNVFLQKPPLTPANLTEQYEGWL